MKRLFVEASKAFVTWIKRNAIFIQIVSTTLEGEDVYTDILCEIRIDGQKTMLHIEFQKKRDATMAERLWNYNVRATLKHKCPVWSCVIYLTKDSTIEAFYCKTLPDGQPIHRFDFAVIKMWEVPTQDLLATGLSDLAPLLALTREGQRREVIETAIALLDPPDGERKGELLTLTYGLASLILANETDQEWLAWRFGMLYDILKDTRAFRELAKEGLQEGLQKGLQEGLQKGLQEGLQKGLDKAAENFRLAVIDVVEARFANPALVEQTRTQVANINDLEVLRHLVVKVAMLSTSEEVVPLLAQYEKPVQEQGTRKVSRPRSSSKKKSKQ